MDLAVVVDYLAAAEAARADARTLTLRVDDTDKPFVVQGVESALRRVVGALLDNAIGHTPPGGNIQVALGRHGGQIELTVRDDGVGFDPRDTERIFQRFTRGGLGEGRRFGLGLALVREVVESHGGTVEATGRLGDGATFTVTLPAAPATGPVPVRLVSPGRAGTSPARQAEPDATGGWS